MTATTTKTLEATLAPPTAHKERKLCDLLDTYREGLHEAFDAGCDTMSATSDVVTPYDLPYQAKAALCNYVPQLHDTYNAQELDDDHPVRLTNQAAEFDHSAARDYAFTWWAPQPGRGTNFWIPLRINPAQEDLWHNLLHGDASAGQLRLQQHRTSWTLHVTVEYAHQFEKPVLVLEDLSYIRDDLDYGEWMNRRLHAWAFARLQQRIEDKAREAGLPVSYIWPEYTSQTCHECGHIGYRNGDEFRCTNDECWVSEYHADINAAVNIADRHDPWGESLPLKPAGDDISRDGSACDSATTHRETSEEPSQMTLSAFHGSEPSASNSRT